MDVMDAATLNNAIAEVCPVVSTSVGKADDRATWTFEPGEGATQEQIDAGNNIIATIPVEVPPPPPSQEDAALYNHENRIRGLEGRPPLSLEEFRAKS